MIAYFKHTSGSTFTLSGEAYKGFFFVDGGVAYAGKDTYITSQPLSSTNTFRADSYLKQFEFDRTITNVSATHTLEKPDISPRSVLSDVTYQRNLDMLHTNNVKLFRLGVLANSNILDFGSDPNDSIGSGFLGLSSGTTDIRNDDTVLFKNNTDPIHIDPYSMTENVPAVVDLDNIINGDIVIGDNEDTFFYFVNTTTDSFVLSGSMSRGSSLREVNSFIPNTDRFHYDSFDKKLWTYTYVNDDLTITIYDTSLYESCQTTQVYDRQLLTIKGADITTLRTGRRLKGIIADTYASSQIETIYDEVEIAAAVVDPSYDPVTALEDLWAEGSEDIESCIPIVLMYNEVTHLHHRSQPFIQDVEHHWLPGWEEISPNLAGDWRVEDRLPGDEDDPYNPLPLELRKAVPTLIAGDWVARELVVDPSNVSHRNPLGLDESWRTAYAAGLRGPHPGEIGYEMNNSIWDGIRRQGRVSPMPEVDTVVRWKPAETADAIINKRAEIAGGEDTAQHQAWLYQYTSVDWDTIPPIRLPRWDEGPGPESTVNQNRAHENFLVLTLHALGYTSTDRLYEGPAVDPVPGQATVRGPANSEWVLVEGFTGLDSKEKMHQRIVADNLLCIQAFFSQELPESVVVYTEPVAYTKPKRYEGTYSICIYHKDSSEIFKKFTKTEFNDEAIMGFDIRAEDDSMIVMTFVSDHYLNMYHIDLSGDGIVPSPTLVRRFRESTEYHYPSIESDEFSVSFSVDDSNVFTIIDSGFITTRFISNPEYPSSFLQRSNLMFPPDLLFSDTVEKFGKIQMKFNTNSLKSNYYNFKNIATANSGGNRYVLYQNIGRIYFKKLTTSTSYKSGIPLDLPYNYTVNAASCKSSIGLVINTDIQELITDTISILVNTNVKVSPGLVEGIPMLSKYEVGSTIEIDPTNFFMYSNENLNYLTVSRMFDQIYSLQETVYNNII